MAQLNPNFEIDFNDINSYEQIQLINDTQLAKENLLMHKAYKEPAEDEIIRNQFSSFTFVDFCPKLFTVAAGCSRASSRPASSASRHQDDAGAQAAELPPERRQSKSSSSSGGGRLLRHQNYELETFSDLFDRINVWLKLNKDWRVVSMETLIFDCTSQFNHLKSSIHAPFLPRNMRGLRLYLSPSKSRFSGHQKIGCINVIPRKLAGHYRLAGGSAAAAAASEAPPPLVYETLEQILARLNELLLTRPIEVNGYVNTETNYFMDARLNLLDARICTHAREQPAAPSRGAPVAGQQQQQQHAHGLADVLRVYYEFGPMVCGLVNLLDFLPHFHRQASGGGGGGGATATIQGQGEPGDESEPQVEQPNAMEIDASETLTRLVRRSLAWFEEERKRILRATSGGGGQDKEAACASSLAKTLPEAARSALAGQQINLKLCNLQIHSKVLLKSQLAAVTPHNAVRLIQTGRMFHEAPREPIACKRCALSSASQPQQEWCKHLLDLNQPYKLKFVRLAYVVPVFSKHAANRLLALQRPQANPADKTAAPSDERANGEEEEGAEVLAYSSPESISQAEAPNSLSGESTSSSSSGSSSSSSSQDEDDDEDDDENDDLADDLHVLEGILKTGGQLDVEELAKEASLAIVRETNERQRASELAHQLGDETAEREHEHEHSAPGASGLIGQLTYRLFAPCQLVNSSSCFSINPINSSSPLSRRGSVNLSSAANSASASASCSLSSENATPSSLLLPPPSGIAQSGNAAASNPLGAHLSESTSSINGAHHQATSHHQQVISFGAFFPALSHEIITTSSPFNLMTGSGGGAASGGGNAGGAAGSGATNAAHFTTNEFEPVEAIKRRMEVYVTTNSMKVLAGETLIVNLSDQLACLSTAIEQTIVKMSAPLGAQAAPPPPSTWVSVYILYAAVDEPHLPGQLLEQQRLRERLALIDELDEGAQADTAGRADEEPRCGQVEEPSRGQDNMVPVFDDDFKSVAAGDFAGASESASSAVAKATLAKNAAAAAKVEPPLATAAPAALNQADGSIRVELERELGAGASSPYNSAYDRTVALPTQPDDHLNDYLEPVDFNLNPRQLADSLGFERADEPAALDLYWATGACQHEPISLTSVSIQAAQRQMRLRQASGGSAMVGGNRQRPLLAAGGAGAGGAKARGRAAKAAKRAARNSGQAGASDSHHCALI